VSNWPELIRPAAVFVIVFAAGWFCRKLLFDALRRRAALSGNVVSKIALQSLKGPFSVWLLIIALYFATTTSNLPERIANLVSNTLMILWIISLTMVAARLATALIRHYGSLASGALPVTTITQNVATLTIAVLGLLVLLNRLGISVTPILTALGVGGLAVALALQDTLSNLFAGFYISIAGQVRVGDYIKLNSSEEGYVSDISWRSTTIRALANNLIIIPNAKLAQAIVTNYHLPERRMALRIQVGVSYDSDPDHVERVLIEEAVRGAGEIPGLLSEPAPVVRFIPGFGDSSLDFTLICHISEFVDQYLVQHELRKRIFKRFRRENIDIPFPIRTVYFKTSAAGAGAEAVKGPAV
jgi:small-conductance mechanosensitive channel